MTNFERKLFNDIGIPFIHRYKNEKYSKDISILKKYGKDTFRITQFNYLRNSGLEEVERVHVKKNTVNDKKLVNNISRARSKVYEYALCNDFTHFVTLTIDNNKCPRNDIKEYWRKFKRWREYINKKYKTKIEYVLVPELHNDLENWHVHGLVKGIKKEMLREFDLDKIPLRLRKSIEKYKNIYNLYDYEKSFGWCSVKEIEYGYENVCKYISKYITKDLKKSINELGKKMYYNSQGLKNAEIIKKGNLTANLTPNFENDYLKIYDLKADTLEDVYNLINMLN